MLLLLLLPRVLCEQERAMGGGWSSRAKSLEGGQKRELTEDERIVLKWVEYYCVSADKLRKEAQAKGLQLAQRHPKDQAANVEWGKKTAEWVAELVESVQYMLPELLKHGAVMDSERVTQVAIAVAVFVHITRGLRVLQLPGVVVSDATRSAAETVWVKVQGVLRARLEDPLVFSSIGAAFHVDALAPRVK